MTSLLHKGFTATAKINLDELGRLLYPSWSVTSHFGNFTANNLQEGLTSFEDLVDNATAKTLVDAVPFSSDLGYADTLRATLASNGYNLVNSAVNNYTVYVYKQADLVGFLDLNFGSFISA